MTPDARETIDAYARHVNPAFMRLLGVLGYGRVFTRAEGNHVFDAEGRRYLDLLAAFGACPLGHNHPALRAALLACFDASPLFFSHVGPSPAAARCAQMLVERAGGDLSICLFSNGGAEAVEAGLKLARAATGRPGFLSCRGAYHGLGLGTLSVMDDARLRGPFEPLLPGCETVPFGDLPALDAALRTKRHAAFVVEPILGEGGAVLPPPGYLAEAGALCRKYGTLLVLDEVQTGLGRTGAMFAYQGLGAERCAPDVVCLAKALGGGALPIGATLVRPEWHRKAYGSMERFDLHGATFAGNALSCAAACATLTVIDAEGLVAAAAHRGEALRDGLAQRLAGHPLVRGVRGRGLMIGVELGPVDTAGLARLAAPLRAVVSEKLLGQWIALRLLESGVIAQPASQAWDVLKLTPPLTLTDADVATAIETLGDVFDACRDVSSVLAAAAARIGRNALRGFAFP